jgi:hypothetical protein
MDMLLKNRCLNHLKKLQSRKENISTDFAILATAWQSTLTDSEGEWVEPQQEVARLLGIVPHSADTEEEESDEEEVNAQKRVSMKSKRRRAVGSRWEGTMRA